MRICITLPPPERSYVEAWGVITKGGVEVWGSAPCPGVKVVQISGFELTGAPVGYPRVSETKMANSPARIANLSTMSSNFVLLCMIILKELDYVMKENGKRMSVYSKFIADD